MLAGQSRILVICSRGVCGEDPEHGLHNGFKLPLGSNSVHLPPNMLQTIDTPGGVGLCSGVLRWSSAIVCILRGSFISHFWV